MINIDSIDPAKNATNVDVNKDIQIWVSADFELDPRNIRFKINNVEVVPSCFSVYNGPNDYSLDIKLYTKRRIKYQSDRRYGQDGVRYGQRDVFPSLLQYGQRYVMEFTVWGTDNNGEYQETTDRFTFSTEEGIFYNNRPPTYFYSDATQGLANYFPEWSKARYDKFSNVQQLLNPIGARLEGIQDFVTEQGLNNFIQTANLNELSVLHRVELGKDFEIKSNLNEDGSLFFVQPEISAIQEVTRYDLFTDQNNDIRSFYYDKLPTRIGTERINVSQNRLFGPVVANEIKQYVNKDLERPGTICLRATGIESSVHTNSRREVLVLKCRVYGESLFGKKQFEDVIVLNDRNIFTTKLWRRIEYVQFFNTENQNITFEINHFKEPLSVIQDTKFITTPDDNREVVLWDAERRGSRTVLRKHVTEGDSGADLLRSSGKTRVVQEYDMLDIDGQTPLELIDVAPDVYSNMMYGISSDYLYVFDKREDYPELLKQVPGDNGLADYIIELDTEESGLDENGEKEICFKTVHKNLGKTVIRYRLRLKKPDGSVLFMKDDGTTTTDMQEATVFVKQQDLLLEERSHSFVTDQVGDHLLELETVYQGGDSSRHSQVVRVLKKSALAKYKLARILNDAQPLCVFFDHDQRLKILTDTGVLHSLVLHKDGVLIDYDNKILYFVEDYESVDVG